MPLTASDRGVALKCKFCATPYTQSVDRIYHIQTTTPWATLYDVYHYVHPVGNCPNFMLVSYLNWPDPREVVPGNVHAVTGDKSSTLDSYATKHQRHPSVGLGVMSCSGDCVLNKCPLPSVGPPQNQPPQPNTITDADRGCALTCKNCSGVYLMTANSYYYNPPPTGRAQWSTTHTVYHYEHPQIQGGNQAGCSQYLRWTHPREYDPQGVCIGDVSFYIETYCKKVVANRSGAINVTYSQQIAQNMAQFTPTIAHWTIAGTRNVLTRDTPTTQMGCECGGAKLGWTKGQAGHSNWCPWYR